MRGWAIIAGLVGVASGTCASVQLWLQIDGTKSFDSLVDDRAAYVTAFINGVKNTVPTFDYGVSVFGDRQPADGAQTTCYYDVVGTGNTSDKESKTKAFFEAFESVDDQDAAEDSISTTAYLVSTQYPPDLLANTNKVMVIVTDAAGKAKGEGGDLEGSTALDNPDSCVTCDRSFELVDKTAFQNYLSYFDIALIVITTDDAANYWTDIVKTRGRGGVLLTKGDGSEDAKRVVEGLVQFNCSSTDGGTDGGGKKGGGKTKIIIIALVCTLLVLAILGAAAWWWRKKQAGGGAPKPKAAPKAAAAKKPAAAAAAADEEEEYDEDEEGYDEDEEGYDEDEEGYDEEEEEEV
ncbi:putative transmembrane protein [Gregarina niphandrodes]|uniref:Transmembrane protein n=1 Tax=Gregarina niphandrodes TaxID=110365 RepID=A0A023B283_GRENI|nr:putative transmembrane protein [Gregarina niphandrodes]EZG51523.1 putative transmembrane protein [Gregarina niphandrodes]|eukprot:XP_011131961.1 putative transmembrane protein [Gregarina niphandrodes]